MDDRTAEAVEHVRLSLGGSVMSTHLTLRDHTVGDVHVLSYDNEDPEHADVHFASDCPGESCPRYYNRHA